MQSDERKPSEVTDDYWVRASCPDASYPGITPQCGKWMVFISPSSLDDVWAMIKAATEEGNLGIGAKASTARPNPRATDENKAIMVYTYNGDDEADVWRVREELRKLGITWKLYWKADETTLKGIYSDHGKNKVWKYSG